MCGIFCAISKTSHILPSPELEDRLRGRGPDSTRTTLITADNAHLTLCSAVLSLRGSTTVEQPFQDPEGQYTLCWNGEAWSIDGAVRTGNDTEAVHKLFMDTATSSTEEQIGDAINQDATLVATALSRVAGPYAFVFYDAPRRKLFVGRDFLGRRSLMYRITAQDEILFSSVSVGVVEEGWVELPADGVYCFYLGQQHPADAQTRPFGDFIVGHASYAFSDDDSEGEECKQSVIPRLKLGKAVSETTAPLTAQSTAVARLEAVLYASLSLRVLDIPDLPDMTVQSNESGAISKLAILFSGGLDCTVLARMVHDLLPIQHPVDLLNVAFENPRIRSSSKLDSSSSFYELCPDRITGRASFAELQRICPGRMWRFIAIDIPYTETNEHRGTVVSLMHPHNTEMDLSISLALYFAARGQGNLNRLSHEGSDQYTTTARVLLSGLGADELFGGYTRHATASRRGGTSALLDELELDVSRLGQRNLGRDDRIMSHWSREVRFPYLDEALLSWALAVPVSEKCGFADSLIDAATHSVDLHDGIMLEPSKKVLRCLAWKLGMRGVAKEKKRAIQFGTRTAKMETRKTKGTQLLS